MSLDVAIAENSYTLAARDALDVLGKKFGIDLLSILDDSTIKPEDMSESLRQAAIPAFLRYLESEGPGEDPAHYEDLRGLLSTSLPSGFNSIPNISRKENFVVNQLSKYTGSQITEFVTSQMNALKLIQASGMTVEAMAGTLLAQGILGVGLISTLMAAEKESEGLTAKFVAAIKKVGRGNLIAQAAILILTIATYLLTGKTSVFMGVVANNTKDELIVKNWREGVDHKDDSDLYLNHGKIIGFMQDKIEKIAKGKDVQILSLAKVPDKHDTEHAVNLGLFCGTKRDWAPSGVEGAMVFTSVKHGSDPRLVLAFSTPFIGKNGGAVALTNKNDHGKKWWNDLQNSLSLQSTASSGSFTASCAVDNASGGTACAIVILSDTA